MGVYIPNMEKPKSCEECLFYELDSIFEDERWSSAPKCLLDGDSDDCPLIEIDDTVWENEKYKLIRMTQAVRINKAMAERRANEKDHV